MVFDETFRMLAREIALHLYLAQFTWQMAILKQTNQ
jgi:hypothetical protein